MQELGRSQTREHRALGFVVESGGEGGGGGVRETGCCARVLLAAAAAPALGWNRG